MITKKANLIKKKNIAGMHSIEKNSALETIIWQSDNRSVHLTAGIVQLYGSIKA